MKNLIAIIILTCFSLTSFAQSINGLLIEESGEPLPFATVVLNQNEKLVKATVSKKDGSFDLKGIDAGNYQIQITSVGYDTYTKDIEYLGSNLSLGRITIKTATENLDAVTVQAERPMVQVLPDKTVFNVQNTINATGSSAFELLRKAPGIIIDNNGNLIVEGKTGVQIYIDGKPSVLNGEDLLNYLESLQANDIESVEIITQPSSKYDAAGNAGIINIKLKKDKSLGTNGSATVGVTIGDFARYNSSVSFNNRSRKGNLYGTYSNRFGKSTNFINLFRRQSGLEFDAKTETVFDRKSNNVKLGYDFYASSKSTIGVILNGNFNNWEIQSDSRTPIRPQGSVENDSVLVANNLNDNQSLNFNANLNYRYADTLGRTVNVDLDYGRYSSDREAFQPNSYFNGSETAIISENITQQITPIDINILTLKADYEQDFLKGKLGIGVKFSDINTDNIFDFFNQDEGQFILDPERSNQFEYQENVNAAYVNYNRTWGKWKGQFGLRMEHTESDGKLTSEQQGANDRVKRSYTNLFPSGGMTFTPNRKNQWALTYSRRIQRPNYASLNPFEYKIDELSASRGNPFLQPQYTDNLKLAHTYNYRLTTSISYSYVSDFFAKVTVADGERANFLTTLNVANQRVVNLGISYPTQITEWWNVYFSLNAYHSEYIATSPEFLPTSQSTLSFYGQNTFTLSPKTTMEVSGWYSSPSVWGGTYQTKSLGSFNVAFQRKLFNDLFTARLAFNDIFYTIPWRGDTRFGNLSIVGTGGNDSRNVSFSLSFNFGRKEIKKARNRKTGLEDEQNRIE